MRYFREHLGSFGIKLLCISACCFAFASIIGWSFYGIKALEFLNNKTILRKIYIIIFVVFVPLSLKFNDAVAWGLTDILNSSMLIINSCFLLVFGGNSVKALKKIRNVLEIDLK